MCFKFKKKRESERERERHFKNVNGVCVSVCVRERGREFAKTYIEVFFVCVCERERERERMKSVQKSCVEFLFLNLRKNCFVLQRCLVWTSFSFANVDSMLMQSCFSAILHYGQLCRPRANFIKFCFLELAQSVSVLTFKCRLCTKSRLDLYKLMFLLHKVNTQLE